MTNEPTPEVFTLYPPSLDTFVDGIRVTKYLQRILWVLLKEDSGTEYFKLYDATRADRISRAAGQKLPLLASLLGVMEIGWNVSAFDDSIERMEEAGWIIQQEQGSDSDTHRLYTLTLTGRTRANLILGHYDIP